MHHIMYIFMYTYNWQICRILYFHSFWSSVAWNVARVGSCEVVRWVLHAGVRAEGRSAVLRMTSHRLRNLLVILSLILQISSWFPFLLFRSTTTSTPALVAAVASEVGRFAEKKRAHEKNGPMESPFQAHGVEGHKAKVANTKVLEIGGLKDFTSWENQNMGGKSRLWRGKIHLSGSAVKKVPVAKARWTLFWSSKKTVSFWVDGVGRCPWSAALLIRVDMSPWTCPASEVPRLWKYRNQ